MYMQPRLHYTQFLVRQKLVPAPNFNPCMFGFCKYSRSSEHGYKNGIRAPKQPCKPGSLLPLPSQHVERVREGSGSREPGWRGWYQN
jgi:hypothetical protein